MARRLLAVSFAAFSLLAVRADPAVGRQQALAAGAGGQISWERSLLEFGARCDNGATDDTEAIQAAFDAAATGSGARTIIWPDRTCRVSRTITVGGGAGPADGATFISIRGSTPAASKLAYDGADRTVALRISLNKYFRIEGLGIHNMRPRGDRIGIQLTGPNADGGTQTLAGQFDAVAVDGFHYGVVAGDRAIVAASSEIRYTNLILGSNDVGWLNQTLNTLDHYFVNLQCGENGRCLQIDSGNAYVDGGSASNDAIDFYGGGVSGAGGTVTVRNVRSEGAGRFVKLAASQAEWLLEGNMTAGPSGTDLVAVEIGNGGYASHVILTHNVLAGKVLINAPGRTNIVMTGNTVIGDDVRQLPWFAKASGIDGYLNQAYITATRNRAAASGAGEGRLYDDVTGSWDGYNFFPVSRLRWNDPGRFNVDTARPRQLLTSVAMLAQGSDARGANLRADTRFAGSATSRFTFMKRAALHPIAGGAVGVQRLKAASGIFTIADIGRRVVMQGALDRAADAHGYVSGVPADDSIDVAPMERGIPGTGGPWAAVIGEDEPDANYIVTGVLCDADVGQPWISGKTAAGFTLHIASPGTATCGFMIVR
ncbi:MAG: hypothetical protein ABI652_02470 [Acidobacteriota bacterium]